MLGHAGLICPRDTCLNAQVKILRLPQIEKQLNYVLNPVPISKQCEMNPSPVEAWLMRLIMPGLPDGSPLFLSCFPCSDLLQVD